MSDDTSNRGTLGQRINMSQEHEVRYWTEKLGVTREELQKAVDTAGSTVSAVEKQLRGGRR